MIVFQAAAALDTTDPYTAWANPLVIAALTAAAVAVIGAFFAGLVQMLTAWRTVAGKVSEIAVHVNSEKTAGEGREAALRKENELLRQVLADNKTTAQLMAQAAVMRPSVEVVQPPQTSKVGDEPPKEM